MIFSAKSASKKQVIRQYYLFFILSFNEKSLSQNCDALEGVHFSFRTNNKIADNPGGYQDFLCSYGRKMPLSSDLSLRPTALGDVFIANGWQKPEGFCESAWESISPYIRVLAHGGEDFFSGWMKDKKTAMISCADGFRPVTFYLEALDEDAE